MSIVEYSELTPDLASIILAGGNTEVPGDKTWAQGIVNGVVSKYFEVATPFTYYDPTTGKFFKDRDACPRGAVVWPLYLNSTY